MKSRALLEQFYDLNVIKPKYRNLLCAATFLEYLENERCYTLTGPDGCYNKFEEEKRQGIIIAELYDISEQLSEIRINQELAADAFSSIDRNISELCAGVNGVRGKIDEALQDRRTQAYYTQQIAEEQRAMNNYTMMRDWLNS